ncbi:MAG: VOC family protein [Chloroflexi bacterium]|nr:VOC family protein [Chloroflexota bacterium]
MRPRMSMITLGVDDIERAIAFYQHGLGFPRHGADDDVAFFALDGTWLGLFGRAALAADAGVPRPAPGAGSFTISHNLHSPAAVDEAMAQALAAGATLVKTPQPTAWGGYGGYFADPDGHLWELAYNPFSWIGPADP